MQVSVVFVTNRTGVIEILKDDLDRQTLKDFEVIIADDLFDQRTESVSQLLKHFKMKHFKPRPKSYGDVWNLNKAYNDSLDKVEGELIVFLQDYIWIPAEGLMRFWELYQRYPNDLVTGCGHKAKNGLEGISELDFRCEGTRDVTRCSWYLWELNYASCPRSVMPRFEEDMDSHYGGENVIISLKAFLNGSKIYLDRRNQCVGYSQQTCGGRPKDWEEKHSNKGYLNDKIVQIIRQHPPTLA